MGQCLTRACVCRALKQFARFDPQSSSQFRDVVDGDIAFTALDGADVGPVQPGEVGQFFLGDALLRPQTPKIKSQDFSLLRDRQLSWHTMRFWLLTTLRLQT